MPDHYTEAGALFLVTFLDAQGVEYNNNAPIISRGLVNYTVTAGSATIEWDLVLGAYRYRIYRSQILSKGDEITIDMDLGFIGEARGTKFTDNNIIPDFGRRPPIYFDPFAPGQIEEIIVEEPGVGYAEEISIRIDDPTGSGFQGYPVVIGGEIVSVLITNHGSGYTEPVVVVEADSGMAAVFRIEVSPLSGTYPSVSAILQQRQIYASSNIRPLTLWGSKTGSPDVFNKAQIPVASSPWILRIDSGKLAPIRHMIGVRGGMLLFTSRNIFLMSSADDTAISNENAESRIESYRGANQVKPIGVDSDILFIEDTGLSIQHMTYDARTRRYVSRNLSLAVRHLVNSNSDIVAWAYAPDPNNLLYMVREDGVLIVMSIDLLNGEFPFFVYETDGLYRDVVSVREDNRDVVYFCIERDGELYFEQEVRRTDNLDEFWGLDSAINVDDGSFSSVLDGLNHLIGKTVGIYSEGNFLGDAVVDDNGEIELPRLLRRAVVGLRYCCYAKTLPLATDQAGVEFRYKLPISISLRVANTRGLKLGTSMDDLYLVKELENPELSETGELKSDNIYKLIPGRWNQEGQIYVVQDHPLPATILSIIREFEIGNVAPAPRR